MLSSPVLYLNTTESGWLERTFTKTTFSVLTNPFIVIEISLSVSADKTGVVNVMTSPFFSSYFAEFIVASDVKKFFRIFKSSIAVSSKP